MGPAGVKEKDNSHKKLADLGYLQHVGVHSRGWV